MSDEAESSDSSGEEEMEVEYNSDNESQSDTEDRRDIRKRYQEIIARTQAKGQEDNTVLSESFNTAEELFTKVRKPREAIFDSTLVNLQASIVKQKIQSLHTNLLEFKPEEFAARFETYLNSSKFGTPRKRSHSEMFQKFGKVSRRVMPTHPPFCPLFNTLEKGNTVIVKKSRQARQKVDEISKVIQKPKTIDSSGKDGSSEASEIPEIIMGVLNTFYKQSKGPVCYFSFIVNPFSFSETIENMFYVSILAKEGAVEISLDEDRLPCIKPIAHDQMKNIKLHGNYSQSIISFDEDDWRTIVKEYDIKQSLIKRKSHPR